MVHNLVCTWVLFGFVVFILLYLVGLVSNTHQKIKARHYYVYSNTTSIVCWNIMKQMFDKHQFLS